MVCSEFTEDTKSINQLSKFWMIKFKAIFVFAIFSIVFFACNSDANKTPTDKYNSGVINISADESFKPIIDEQVKVYEAKYPNVKLLLHYKPESDCIKDMADTNTRAVIITRKFSNDEERFMLDSMKVVPTQMVMAYDAIAIIVNRDAEDSLFTVEELKNILKGKFKKKLIPVFDGVKATSTVRFIVDSLLRGDSLNQNVRAANSSEDVIEYVAKTTNAIGFIGVSWIGNKDDLQQRSFLTKVRLAKLESNDLPGKFIHPVQANIYEGRYPLTRQLVFVLKENYKDGLGHGFKNFVSGELGQLIFRRAYLVPAQMQFEVRHATMREE